MSECQNNLKAAKTKGPWVFIIAHNITIKIQGSRKFSYLLDDVEQVSEIEKWKLHVINEHQHCKAVITQKINRPN